MSDFIFDLQRFALTTTESNDTAFFSAKINDTTYYGTANEFTTGNLRGATEIQLLKDITLDATIIIESGKATLDLNGQKITRNVNVQNEQDPRFLVINESVEFTLTDTSDEKGGSIEITVTNDSYEESRESYAIDNSGTMKIEAGSIKITGDGYYGIQTSGTLDMSGGSIEIDGKGGTVVEVTGYEDTKLNITGGTITAKGEGVTAISNASLSEVEISGNDTTINVEGENSTDVSNISTEAKTNITGGTITVTGKGSKAVSNGNGEEETAGTVTISGGTITATGEGSTAISNNTNEEDETKGTVTISKGTINGKITSNAGEGENSGISITGGNFSSDNADLLVSLNVITQEQADAVGSGGSIQVGDVASVTKADGTTTNYASLEEAVTAIQGTQGATVTLLQDASGNGIKVQTGTGFTLDLGGYTYTIDKNAVGSAGTETQAFQLLKNSNVTFKNGTITSAANSGVKMLIQNYSNLTLDSVNLDGTHLDGTGTHYVLSNNNGATNLTGSTSITANTGDVAFDVYYWPKGGYSGGAQVTVNTTGIITGKVEVSNDGTTSDGSKGKLTLTQGTITGDVTISDKTATVAVDGGTIQGKITNQSTNFTVSSSATLSSTENNLGAAYITKDGKTTYYQTMAAAVEAAETGDTIYATADKEDDLPADYAYTKVTVGDKEVYKLTYVASVAVTNSTTTQYYSLSEAFAAASNVTAEANITLLADVKVDTTINVAKVSGGLYVGLSLNGKTITSTAENTFNVTSGTFRIKSAGTITQSTAGSVIKVSNGAKLWANNFAYTIKNTASDNTAYVIDVSGSGTKADFEGSGTISGAYGVKVGDGAIVTVKGNTTIDATNSNTGNAVGVLVGGGELTVGATGATINPIIKASGGAKNVGILQAGGTLNVTSGTITGGNEAVEDDASTTDVNEAKELVAGTGVEVHAGTFNFDGGTITGKGSSFVDSGTNKSDGTAPLTSGAGIAISQLDASKSLTVNAAKDTNASGFVALAVTNPKSLTGTTTVPSVMVSGGTFQSTGSGTGSWDSTNKQLTSGQYAFLNTDTRITVNLSGSIVTHPDATEDTNKTIKEIDTLKLSDGKYPGYTDTDNGTAFTIPTIMYTQDGKEVYSNEMLAEAVNKADANTIIHLYADKSGNGFTINKNLTIDFGGYTYTITKPESETVTCIEAALGATVTFQNGTVKAEENSTLSTLIESKTNSCTFSNITLDGANLKGTDAYALTNSNCVTFNSGTVINPNLTDAKTSTVGAIKINSHVNSSTWTREQTNVKINGNILVSGNTNWGSSKIQISPPVNGDLLLDDDAAKAGTAANTSFLGNVKLQPRMNTVTAEDRMFSDNSFIVGDGTTVYPSDKLIAYKLNSTDSLYHVGKGDGWITLASGEGAASVVNWVHIAPSLEGSRISAAVTKFSGLSTVEQDTSVALDTVNGVAGINAAVTLATTTTGEGDDAVTTPLIPTATLVSNESTTLNVAEVLFDNKENPIVASITTYVDKVTITDSIYGSSVTAVTAANINDSTIGIYIAGNDKVTSIVGGDGADSLTAGDIESGGVTLDGGKGNDTLTGGTGNDSLIGGEGNDLFVMSGGTASISDYTADDDTIQLAESATVTVDGDNVKFTAGTSDSASVLVVEDSKDKFISSKIVGETSIKTARYYADGAEMIKNNDDYTLFLGKNFTTSKAAASDYTITGGNAIEKVSLLSDVGADSITFYGFKEIYDFRAAADKVSTDAAPSDANFDTTNKELSVSLGTGETSTLKLKLTETLDDKKYVTFTAGGKTYQVADSELIENKAVTLTSSYDKTTYTAESSITAIDASAATLGIDLNASATAGVSITGSTKNDTLTGGSGSDSLFGGAGNDLFIVSGGTDTISDYTFTSVDSGEKDTIKSSSALKSTEASGDKDIKFTFADNSTLIVANAIGNSISTSFANVAETKVYGNIVASITKDGETVNYLTLDQAITAAATTDTITLKDNITLSETLTLNKNITVDLAGKTITADGVTAVNVTGGTFTVKDSGTGGKITSNVNASVGDQATIYVSGSGAKFVLESGTMENSGGAVGDTTGTNGRVLLINSGATAELKGGSVTATAPTDGFAINNQGTLNISGSVTVHSSNMAVYNLGSGTAEISGGTITSDNHIAVEHSGTGNITISGGTITGNGGSAVSNNSTGSMTISGGTINDACKDEYDHSAVSNNSTGSIIISGGTFTSSRFGVDNQSGTLTVNNGNITGEIYGVINRSDKKAIINGGNITGTNSVGVINYGNGDAEINGGTFTGKVCGVYNFADGAVAVKKSANIGEVKNCVATITTGTGDTEVTTYYTTLENAIAAAKTDETVKLIGDAEITKTITVASGKKITLDLNGKAVTCKDITQAFTVAGEFIITDTATTAGTITGDVLLSGTSAKLNLTKGTITGNLLLDANAATASWNSNVTISSDSKFIKKENETTTDLITSANKDKLFAYKATSTVANYNVGEEGWYAATEDATWNHLTAEAENSKLGKFDVTLNNVASIGAATTVTIDGDSTVIGLGADISVNSGSTPTAKVGETSNYNVAIITNPATDIASVKTYTNGVKITDTLYGGTVTKVTATENTYGVNIAGNSKVTSMVGGSGADSLTAGNNDATLDGGAGNDSLVGGKSLSGGAGADTLTAGNGGATLDGGADNDSLVGGSGKDLFVMSAGTDSISGYDSENDTLQITESATVTVEGNNVKFSGGADSVLIAEGVKDNFITSKIGESIKTARYYDDGAEVVKNGDDYTLVLGENFKTSTASASNYTQTSGTVEKVSLLSGVGATAITFDGFASIDGFRAAKDKVSTDAAPTDANIANNELSVSLGSDTLKVTLAETLGDKKYVTLTAGTTEYQVADGELISNNQVTLTNSYNTANVYNVASGIVAVDASSLTSSNSVNINAGSLTTAVTLTGGAGADTLTAGSGGSTLDGGAGNDSLVGGDGADLFLMSAGSDSISGYAESDTLQLAESATVTVNGNDVKFSVGTDSVLVVESAQDKFITSKVGESIKTARYYDDGAEVVKVDNEYILVLGENFKTSTAAASDYTQTGGKVVEKVSLLSGVGATAITFDGFKEIDGFRAAADKVSTGAAPTDANINGQELSVSLGNDTLKVTLAETLGDKKYVTLTAGTTEYQIADGELIADSKVTLTNSYDTTNVYSVASGIVAVDASSLTSVNAVQIDAGSLATAVTLLGGAGNDTLTGGTGNNSLDGGAGDDLINVTGSTGTTVNVSLGNDTISVGGNVTKFAVENFNTGDVIKLTTAAYKIETINGGIKAGSVSISGLDLSTVGDWTLSSENVARYAQTTLEGATLGSDSLTVGYRERKESATTLIELGGIETINGLTVDDTASVVSIGKDNFIANGASISTNAGNYTFNLTAGEYGGKTFAGSDKADTITILDGANSLIVNGGDGSDVLTTSGTLITLTGGAGNDLFVMSKGTATITDYNNADGNSDTIQFTSAPTFKVSGDDVTFANDFVVSSAKGKFITTKVNDATTVAAYYENASINGDDKTKLILGAYFAGTATAANYTVDSASVTAVDASAATSKAITFDGFASIGGFNASNHTLSGTPDDAAISGSDLVIALDNSSVTIADAATSTINLISGETNYTASKGIITNLNSKLVSLTGNYDTQSAYKVASDIKEVTAARIDSTTAKVTLDGSETNGVKLTGSSGADSIVGGAGADELTGGTGADKFVMSAGNDSINDYEAGTDIVELLTGATITAVDSGVTITDGTDTTLIENTALVAYTKLDKNATFYSDLQAALSAGGSVTLLKNVEPSATLTINKDVTLDLNGFNIASTATNAIEVTNGTFEIKDSATTAGTITGNILLNGTSLEQVFIKIE